MKKFRDFKTVDNYAKSIEFTEAIDIFKYTIISVNKFEYIEIPILYDLMSFKFYYVLDNYSHIKKNEIFLTGKLEVASKSDLISYISDSQINDLPENMRFIDTELKGPVFCLNDDLELICFKRK